MRGAVNGISGALTGKGPRTNKATLCVLGARAETSENSINAAGGHTTGLQSTGGALIGVHQVHMSI